MNKYHWDSLKIVSIVLLTFVLSKYWLDLHIGYGSIFLIMVAGYNIYLNFNKIRDEQKEL